VIAMMLQYFENIVSGLEAKIKENPDGTNARKKYTLETVRLGQRLYSGTDKVAWCGVTVPYDVLAAMGVTSCFTEFIGATLANSGLVGSYLEESEHAGQAAETCGYHRAVIGAAMKGMMPTPEFMIASTCPCSGGVAVMENLARMMDRDLFVLHIPQEENEHSVRFLAGQLKEMTAFVSAHTGEALDEDKLREAMQYSNQTRDLLVEVYDLAKKVPSPANGRLMGNFGIVAALFLGTRAGVDVVQAYRDEFKETVERGASGVPDERLRLMWIQNRIQFKNPLVDMLEKEYKASIVIDELNDIEWGPINLDDPFTSLARRAISVSLNGSVSRRVNHLQELARDYKIDGAVNPCHWGCRQGTGSRGLVQAGLGEIGVPVANLEVDCVDSRNFAEGQLRTRLEAFVEMLETRASPLRQSA